MSFAQDKFPKGVFTPPVDTPILLAGNFAELRPNHFHGGIDIKTGGVEGKNVYSIYDGYVSRIKISHKGYGKSISVQHPNGYVSVYAHLQKLSDTLENYLKKYQYLKKTYEIELFPDSTDLPVKKGQVIAISGNTGSSSAPHLHFEIRDKDDETYNPLLFGFDIKDDIKPSIYMLGVFPINKEATINKKSTHLLLKTNGSNGKYFIPSYKPIEVSGQVGFGISSLDFLCNSSNQCGIYSIELLIDSVTYFKHTLDQVAFDDTRYINSLVHFEIMRRYGMKIQRCYVEPGNHLKTYSNLVNEGIFFFDDSLNHAIKIIVKDSHFNTSELSFTVKSVKPTYLASEKIAKIVDSTFIKHLFLYNQPNAFENEECKIEIPEGSLYDNIDFKYSLKKGSKGLYSNIHQIHDVNTPLHKAISVSIKAMNLPVEYENKCFIANVGNYVAYEGGKYQDGYVTGTVKNFGDYAIAVDVNAPTVYPVNISQGKNISKQNTIIFKVKDDLSGIGTYHASINDTWVLMEYEYKNNTLTYHFDENMPKEHGYYDFKLIVNDKVGNSKEYKISFKI